MSSVSRSFPTPQLAAQPNSFRAFPQSHLSVLTTRHSCALPSLSKVEKSKEKRSLAANPFRIRISAKHARNPFRMCSFKIQHLKPFRMCSSKKRGGGVPQDFTANSASFGGAAFLCYRAACMSNPFLRHVMRRRAFFQCIFSILLVLFFVPLSRRCTGDAADFTRKLLSRPLPRRLRHLLTSPRRPTFFAALTAHTARTTICSTTISTFASIPTRNSSAAKTPFASRCSQDGTRIQLDLQQPLQIDKILLGTTPSQIRAPIRRRLHRLSRNASRRPHLFHRLLLLRKS